MLKLLQGGVAMTDKINIHKRATRLHVHSSHSFWQLLSKWRCMDFMCTCLLLDVTKDTGKVSSGVNFCQSSGVTKIKPANNFARVSYRTLLQKFRWLRYKGSASKEFPDPIGPLSPSLHACNRWRMVYANVAVSRARHHKSQRMQREGAISS